MQEASSRWQNGKLSGLASQSGALVAAGAWANLGVGDAYRKTSLLELCRSLKREALGQAP